MHLLAYLGAYALISLIIAASVGYVSRDVVEAVLYLLLWPLVCVVLGFMFVVAWYVKHGARHDI